jgi:hypothetical protein
VDTITVSVFTSGSGALDVLLVRETIGVRPAQRELVISLDVPSAPRYRIEVGGLGRRQRPGRRDPTAYGLQFLGEAAASIAFQKPEPIVVAMSDVVPLPILTPGPAENRLQWSPVIGAIQYRVLAELGPGNTVFDTTITGTTLLVPFSSAAYRVRSELSANLASAFSEEAAFSDLPAPTLSSLVPDTAVQRSPQFLMQVNGSNFLDGAIVTWDGVDLPTKFVSASREIAAVKESLVGSPGSATVRVRNLDDQLSNGLTFTIAFPPPSISALVPDHTIAGSPQFKLAVIGADFQPRGRVTWNGDTLPTQFMSATVETATVSAALVRSPGRATVNVRNPDDQVSKGSPFTIIAVPTGRAEPRR